MPFKTQENINCDVLIVGGGGAGLRAAIEAASCGADVLMVSKTRMGHATNTYLSKAIIASPGYGDVNDGSHVHTQDTIQGGRYLNNPEMVAQFTGAIQSETNRLQDWGVKFGLDEKGRPMVLKVPGHRYARHVYGSNWKGSDLVLPLKQKAMESNVRFLEHLFVSALMVSGSRICGVTGIMENGTFVAVEAKAIVIATGGFGQVFLNTNNAPGTTGDGHALAYNAGLSLQDMEFVQFYPTARGNRGSRILLYEKLLGQTGVTLKNSKGRDILKKNGYPDAGDITRDQLAQVIMKEIIEDPEHGGTIDMDLSGLPLDTAKSLSMLRSDQFSQNGAIVRVVPTTHFCMGGICVDTLGKTRFPELFAAGEVTAGAHGANRLGGNALAEVIAMGAMAGRAAAERAMTCDGIAGFGTAVQHEKRRLDMMFGNQGRPAAILIQELKETMWFNAGIIRDRQSLCRALEKIMTQQNDLVLVSQPRDLIRCLEFRNMGLVAELICRSALERTESRGAHFRSDYPEENNPDWLKNIQVRKTDTGVVLDPVRVSGSHFI